jgi:hypothetical protein
MTPELQACLDAARVCYDTVATQAGAPTIADQLAAAVAPVQSALDAADAKLAQARTDAAADVAASQKVAQDVA